MSTPIKTWEYPSTPTQTDKVDYFEGYLLKTFGFKTPRSNEISINRMLNYHHCLTNSILEPQIIADLIRLNAFKTAKFTEEEEKHWRFWKCLDSSQLTALYCEAISPSKSKTFLELSPAHLKNGFCNASRKQYSNNNRLDNLFFYGPKLVGMQLEDRQKIRQIVCNALPTEAKFSLKDAFPLFDYSKIEPMRWEKTAPDKSSGEYLELHADRLTIGGWSGPRDGGSYDVSLERIWWQLVTSSTSGFKGAYESIYAQLKKAIIKD